MLRSGALQPGQTIGHRFRHVITNAVGGPEAGVKVEARALEVRAGDRLLLCSDGLTGAVTDEIIAATLAAEATPEAAAKALMARATEGPASDNITLVVVRFESTDAAA
jgi:serine/threonine protein phosphatase PrpC